MSRYRMRVEICQLYEVDVESPSSWEAAKLAEGMDVDKMTHVQDCRDARLVREYGPIRIVGDYPEGLFVFSTPVRTTFTQADVDDILQLVEEHVGPVQEHWNGIGVDSLSVRLVAANPKAIQERALRDALQRRYDRSAEAAEIAAKIKADIIKAKES